MSNFNYFCMFTAFILHAIAMLGVFSNSSVGKATSFCISYAILSISLPGKTHTENLKMLKRISMISIIIFINTFSEYNDFRLNI